MEFYQHQKNILADDPLWSGLFLGTGSGKTRIAVNLAQNITLVICPKTQTLDGTWTNEWKNSSKTPGTLFLISYEQFKKACKDGNIWKYPKPTTVILDEAHKAFGVRTETWQKDYVQYPKTSTVYDYVKQYIDLIKPERFYMLTATPTPTPLAIYAAGTLLGKNWDYFKFRQTFYFQKGGSGRPIWLVKKSKAQKEHLATMVNKLGYTGRLQDWFDVPTQTYKVHDVGTTKEMEMCLPELKELYPDPLVQLGKRHQLEQGIYEGKLLKENKIEAILKYHLEFEKIVVFCKYTAQIELYEKALRKHADVYTLTGATKDRGEVIRSARASSNCIFIAQSSISAGYELPDFPCMVFASESFSFVDRDQAEGRILRANNLKKNLYVTLVAGAIDDKVHATVKDKQDFAEHIFAKKFSQQNKLR